MGSFWSKNILAAFKRNQNFTKESSVSQALQNEMILENISSYLSLGDLKNFRLVNRVWNKASLNSIRKNCILRLRNEEGPKRPRFPSFAFRNKKEEPEEFLKRNIKRYEALTQLISNSVFGFPCSNIDVKWIIVFHVHEFYISEKFLDDFFLAISGFVTQLDVCASFVYRHTSQFYLPTKIQFPHLTTLELPYFPLFPSKKGDKMLECFTQIVQNSPQLNALVLKSIYASNISTCLEAMTIQQQRQISTLYLKFHKWDELLPAVNQNNFRLKKLWLSFGDNTESLSENLMTFLESQSKCLEMLCIERYLSAFTYVTIQFPRMENLKLLKLVIFNPCLFPELNYKQQFPVLTHLLIDCDGKKLKQALNSQMEPLHTVHTLVLGVQYYLDSEIIIQMAQVFPNVKRLKMLALKKVLLQTAGNVMENLEELTLVAWEEHVSDLCEVLTGYTQSELERIAKLTKSERKKLNKEPLAFLHNLKILRIQDTVVGITDILCELGPMKLRSLECLDFSKSKELKISQRMVDKMREQFLVFMPYKYIRPRVEQPAFEFDNFISVRRWYFDPVT